MQSLSSVVDHCKRLKICHHHITHQTSTMPSGKRWGPWRSLLVLSPILICAPFLAYHHHYSELHAGSFCTFELMARTLCKIQSFRNLCTSCENTILAMCFKLSANHVDIQNESYHKASPDLRVAYPRCCEISLGGYWISHSWHPGALPCGQVDGTGCRTRQTKLPENSQ